MKFSACLLVFNNPNEEVVWISCLNRVNISTISSKSWPVLIIWKVLKGESRNLRKSSKKGNRTLTGFQSDRTRKAAEMRRHKARRFVQPNVDQKLFHTRNSIMFSFHLGGLC